MENNNLTIEKLMEAVKKVQDAPKPPIIIFSWGCPYDKVIVGEAANIMAKRQHPYFDPETQKAYIISKRYKKDLEAFKWNSIMSI